MLPANILVKAGDEQVWMTYSEMGYAFFISYDEPSLEEITTIKNGELQLSMVVLRDILHITLTFQDGLTNLPPMDIAYYANLNDRYSIDFDSSESLEQLQKDDGSGSLAQIILIDNRSNIVAAHRIIKLGNDFSLHVLRAILQMNYKTLSTADFTERVYANQQQYSVEQLIQQATVIDRVAAPTQ
ncbi:hypothetical protein KSI01_18030 [Kurthia sibirica]|uniref:Uncharacterized protein n=2 Tax=Kurthia sibirica TaxID=202750 RepID=A0A2U3AN21_9BACL|nr:hypothetical protein DEX24_05125 [Kurthia sibirica]GEK34270.1 hypothetical protein KSI01_18030 [Kurthia sibirica]